MVYGHSTSGDQVDLYSYVEYDTFDDSDRYRLADIQARNSNRDGAALRYVGRASVETARTEQDSHPGIRWVSFAYPLLGNEAEKRFKSVPFRFRPSRRAVDCRCDWR